jgi:hypothetical protein
MPSSGRVVDRSGEVCQGQPCVPVRMGDDFRGDRNGRLLGRAGTEVEPDGGTQPYELLVGDIGFAQEAEAFVVGAPGAHGADVADRQVEGEPEQGDVELGVVGEDADGGAGVYLGVFQVAVGPVDDDLVRVTP